MEPILGACSLPPLGFQQIQCAHNLTSVPSVFEYNKHPSTAVFSEIESGRKQPRRQIFTPNGGFPRSYFETESVRVTGP